MKKSITIILLTFLPGLIFSQYFEIRTWMNDLEYLVVEMRDTTSSNTVTTVSELVDLQFEIRWTEAPDVAVDLICAPYPLEDGLGAIIISNGHFWRAFCADPVAFYPPDDWIKDQWQLIAKFKVTAPASDTGNFAPAPDEWVVQGLNLNVDGIDYEVHVADSADQLPYPTTVYDYVWRGGNTFTGGYDEYSWTNGLNWEAPCGNQYGSAQKPTSANNCVIPGGLTYYPANFANSTSETCLRLRMQPGAQLEVPNGITLNVLKDLLSETGALLDVKNGGTLDLKNQ